MTDTTNNSPAVELTLIDLQNIRSIIDIASRRGAFGAAEMTGVGTVFDKLTAFLKAVTPDADTGENTQSKPE